MLKSYLGMQQKQLEQLGKVRQELRNISIKEEQRALNLQNVIGNINQQSINTHPLFLHNKQQLLTQLEQLQAHQVQQVAIAQLELTKHESHLVKHFSRVKGIELLLTQREKVHAQHEELKHQRQIDELVTQRYLRQQRDR
jgi:flagellar export protein FliJ